MNQAQVGDEVADLRAGEQVALGAQLDRDPVTSERVGKQAGLSQQQVETCLNDKALLDKLVADQKYASEVLKVDSTPTFFINGEKMKGESPFEEFQKRINPLLQG